MLTLVFTAVTANAQELIKNGNFELNPRVEQGTSATTGWDSRKPVVVTHVDPISADNPHYAVICCDTLYNEGAGGAIDMTDIQLIDEQCKPIAETTIRVKGQGWQQFNRQFTASATCTKARLAWPL